MQLPQVAAHLALSFLVATAKGETQIITKCAFSLRYHRQLLERRTAYFDPEASENSLSKVLRKGAQCSIRWQ